MYVDNEVPLAAIFPLPFRVLFLIGLGLLGWATNLHILQQFGINGPGVLEFHASVNHLPLASPSSGPLPARSFYTPIYRILAEYTLWCLSAWLIFRAATRSDTVLVDIFRYVPAVCILGLGSALVCPYDIFYKRERDWFLRGVAKCFYCASNGTVQFSDVIFADILTSFAKVLGDMWISLCMLLPGGSLLRLPSQDGWYQWILPSLMSLPYLIRFRQCLIEYRSPKNTSRRPLFNAIKYASSFPVIFLSAAQRIVISDLIQTHGNVVMQQGWHGEHPLFRLWLVSVVINSLYSFWWDLTNDWGLDLLTSKTANSREGSPSRVLTSKSLESFSSADQLSSSDSRRRRASYPYGLRPVLLYPLAVYPMVIFLNFILRMTWSIKLSSHLHLHSDGSALIFWLEMAEVLRRWVWVFLRIEWEVAKKGLSGAHAFGSGNGMATTPLDDVEFQVHSKRAALD